VLHRHKLLTIRGAGAMLHTFSSYVEKLLGLTAHASNPTYSKVRKAETGIR